ncbi:cytochrome c [Alphaproteobacteria bacterium LSUCC0684]
MILKTNAKSASRLYITSLFAGSFVVVSGVLIGGLAHAHKDATGIVKERMDNFKKSQENLKSIRRLIRDGEAEAIVPLADEIRNWAVRIPEYFPEGSGAAPSEAAAAIWEDVEGFRKAARSHEQAADTLSRLARSGDIAGLDDAFGELAGSCKACHQRFRQ